MRARVMRVVALCGVAMVAGAIAWYTWPRPDLDVQIQPGGSAEVLGRTTRTPMSDTVVFAHAPVRVRIANDDSVAHRLGMFAVGRGETREFSIGAAGVYSGYCSAHPGRQVTYIVQ